MAMTPEHRARWMAARVKHGGYLGGKEQPLHYIWRTMLARCHRPGDKAYVYYGGRGIAVCERWHDYQCFEADMGPHPGPGYSLGRLDNDGPYSTANCRWETASEQQRNTRRNKYYWNGCVAVTLVEAAEMLEISKELAHWRFKTQGTFEKGTTWQQLQNFE